MKYLRKFDSVSEMNTVIANSTIGILGLAYNNGQPVMKKKDGGSPVPPTPTETRLIVTYNVTSISEPTMLYPDFLEEDEIAMPFTAMEIDGVQYNNIGYSDCFFEFNTTGTHIVKYTLVDNSEIGESAFEDCESVSSVIIPDNVTNINNLAFSHCTGLTSITIPESVTTINSMAFSHCTGLNYITCEAITPPTLIGINVFSETNNCPIYVPTASVNTYKAASGWSDYASRIQAIQS